MSVHSASILGWRRRRNLKTSTLRWGLHQANLTFRAASRARPTPAHGVGPELCELRLRDLSFLSACTGATCDSCHLNPSTSETLLASTSASFSSWAYSVFLPDTARPRMFPKTDKNGSFGEGKLLLNIVAGLAYIPAKD